MRSISNRAGGTLLFDDCGSWGLRGVTMGGKGSYNLYVELLPIVKCQLKALSEPKIGTQ